MANISDLQLLITEQTVKELSKAIEKAHKANFKIMCVEALGRDVRFLVDVELKPHTQESLGYRIVSAS